MLLFPCPVWIVQLVPSMESYIINNTEEKVMFLSTEQYHKQLFMHELKLNKKVFSVPEQEVICCDTEMKSYHWMLYRKFVYLKINTFSLSKFYMEFDLRDSSFASAKKMETQQVFSFSIDIAINYTRMK